MYDIQKKIEEIDKEAAEMFKKKAPQLIWAKQRLEELAHNFDVRKMAARVEDKKEDYYILCGWMAEDDVKKFMAEAEQDDKVFVVVEDDHDSYFGEPPTKLENPKLFKPFEMFVGMYGLPAHNEMDPTLFVGLTYSFIFGVMFGDVGAGAFAGDCRSACLPFQEVSFGRNHCYGGGVFHDFRFHVRKCVWI